MDEPSWVSEGLRRAAAETGRWMREHPEGLADAIERDRREWPGRRRELARYLRRLSSGRAARRPEWASERDVLRAERDLAARRKRSERRWSVLERVASVIGILGGIAAIASLVLQVIG